MARPDEAALGAGTHPSFRTPAQAAARAPFLRRALDTASVWARTAYRGLKLHGQRLLRDREVSIAIDRRAALSAARLVAISPIRNDAERVPYFLRHYRAMGIEHFVFVDNGSTDGLLDLLRAEPDVTVFRAEGSFKRARYGMDWVNGILSRHCVGKWCLHVDTDEFLVFPDCERRGLDALAGELEALDQPALNCVMVDMYSDRPVAENVCPAGCAPIEVCDLFDTEGYERRVERQSNMVWIKGGVRSRLFFPDVWAGPALNKTPLVKWRRHYAFVHCAHQLWPPSAHGRPPGDEAVPTGALLHFKFLAQFTTKIAEESARQEHTAEYGRYRSAANRAFRVPRAPCTATYRSSRDFEAAGLIRRGWAGA